MSLMLKADRYERPIEATAVLLNLLYLYLYIEGSRWCWPAAFAGSALFVWLCQRRQMLAEVVLQLFYIALAVYGFFGTSGGMQNIEVWSLAQHVWLIAVSTLGTVAMGAFLRWRTRAALPWLDSFTTVFSLSATWVMVNLVHENYLYWMVIDSASVYLYWSRGLRLGAGLFVIYFVMVVLGYFHLM
jgi:nicotinamide mononucleotide transporter